MSVTTSLSAGVLTITGDADSDNIAIVGTSNAGELTVTGRNGATVDGVPNGSATIAGVSSDLIINLGDGNNVLSIDNAYINGEINITSGEGADLITLGEFQPVSPRDSLRIFDLGDLGGDDIVRLGVTRYSVFVGSRAFIDLHGGGNDQVALYGASSVDDTTIQTHTGDDSIYVYGFTSHGGLALLGDEGNNSLAAIACYAPNGISLRGLDGSNSFYVQDVYTIFGLDVIAHIGAGPDNRPSSSVITVSGCLVDAVQIVGTRGHDEMTIVGNNVSAAIPQSNRLHNTMMIDGLEGDDNIQVHYNFILENLFARMGDGNDFLWFNTNNVRGRAELDGGFGTNSLRLSGNVIGTLAMSNFTMV
jgi:hypothetical protein